MYPQSPEIVIDGGTPSPLQYQLTVSASSSTSPGKDTKWIFWQHLPRFPHKFLLNHQSHPQSPKISSTEAHLLFAISTHSIRIEQYQPTKRYRVNILAAFTPVSHLKIGFYTEGYAPFLCRSHSVLSDHRRGVHPSEQRARCAKRSLYTEGLDPLPMPKP